MKTSGLRRERELRRYEGYRKTILHAAERVILRKGYSATTMDDVAREAQFSKATLYKYVPGKGVLLFEIMGHYLDEVRDRMAEILAGPGTAGERLRLSIRMILLYQEDKENIARVLWMDNAMLKLMRVFAASTGKASSEMAADRKMLGLLQRKTREITEMGVRLVEEGIAAGEFRRMDSRGAVAFIEAVLQGYAHNRFWHGEAAVKTGAADLLARFVLEGIRNLERPVKEN
ncbi:MAG TPA: TetR/AcrR family transcriptional regulator [Candidatus Latescibacteria bacterium]|nr:TetR/AcrR family transcriptional regulator [Candidatus Latescibacterota bacterium]